MQKCKDPKSQSAPPSAVRAVFSADVLKWEHQKILVVRKNITTYTGFTIVKDEWLQTLLEDLVESIIAISPCDGQMSVA